MWLEYQFLRNANSRVQNFNLVKHSIFHFFFSFGPKKLSRLWQMQHVAFRNQFSGVKCLIRMSLINDNERPATDVWCFLRFALHDRLF